MCSYCGCENIEVVGRFMAEHVELDRWLDAIAAGDHGSFPAFDRALRVHVDREENGLFPAAAIALAGAEWQRVADLTAAADVAAADVIDRGNLRR